jgi:adenosylhomocysteine nucleosidase
VILEAAAAATVDNSVDLNPIDPRPVLIVTGLVQEARIAAGPGMIVICSSSDPQQLRALLATLDPSSFRGVISFGVAGGLDPSLKSGDVVVATEVLSGDTRFLAGLALNEEMIASAALKRRRVVRGGLAGVEQVIAATACKAALHSETGAAAVDMESQRGGYSIRGAARHFGSRQPISSGAGEERHQAERRYRSAQGIARPRAQSGDAARAGLHRNRFQSGAAQLARLPGFPDWRRGPRLREYLTAASDRF